MYSNTFVISFVVGCWDGGVAFLLIGIWSSGWWDYIQDPGQEEHDI